MAFQISPGVNITEIDRTGVVAQISTTSAGFAGNFKWGPVNQIVAVDSENTLVQAFGQPQPDNKRDFFSAANFLGYGAALQIVRSADSAAMIASPNGGLTGSIIWNDKKYDEATNYGTAPAFSSGAGTTAVASAKYVGMRGNSLKWAYSDNFERGITFTGSALTSANIVYLGSTGAQISCTNPSDKAVVVGDNLLVGGVEYPVVAFPAGGTLTIAISGSTAAFDAAIVGSVGATVVWAYANYAPYAPGTSSLAAARGYTGDEVAFVLIDEDGVISGTPGEVLESFIGSKASNAVLADGVNNYYANKINQSEWIRWVSHPASGVVNLIGTTWGAAFAYSGGSGGYQPMKKNVYQSFSGGTDAVPVLADTFTAYDEFKDADNVDVSLLLQGAHPTLLAKYIVDICDTRKDCVAFVSPEESDVKDKTPQEAYTNVIDFKKVQLNKNSSYAVLDSGWKYQYDRYTDSYLWMPLNPDIAGLCARTDSLTDPWFSPAGYNRGQIRNVVKLAFNPSKALRDGLYANSINPVISQPGQGTLLFGDKTLLSKPSAFDRINVRRLFITLEKAVATAAKFQLFEFNDEFSRANFLGIVEPFLRDVVSRRGITDFKVVCDESNNTAEVIDKNQFVADIYIKPNRSTNYIQLNFIAVRSNVQFNEVGASITI